MLNKQLVCDHFGQNYVILRSGKLPILQTAEAKPFHSRDHAVQFIRTLRIPVDFWLNTYKSETLITQPIQSQAQLADAVAELLYSGKIKAYKIDIPSPSEHTPEKRTIKDSNKNNHTFIPTSSLLISNPKEVKKFESKADAEKYLNEISADEQQLKTIAKELDLAENNSEANVFDSVVTALSTGSIVIAVDRYSAPPASGLDIDELIHGDKDASQGPATPECTFDMMTIQCSHFPKARSYKLDVVKDKPNLNDYDKALQVIAKPGDPDEITVNYSGTCANNSKKCPAIKVSSQTLNGTFTENPYKFKALPLESEREPGGFLDFLKYYLVPDLSSLKYQVYTIEKSGCNGNEGNIAKVHAFPTFKWAGNANFGYTKKDEKDAETKNLGARKSWHASVKIDGEISTTKWNLESKFDKNKQLFPKLQSVLEGFFGQISDFYEDNKSEKSNKFDLESNVSIGGELELQENSKDFDVDLGGNINLSLNPLIKADVKYDMLEGIINKITYGIGPFLKRIKAESDKAKRTAEAIKNGAEKVGEIRDILAKGRGNNNKSIKANIRLDLIISGTAATELKWNKAANQPWGISQGDIINKTTARIDLKIEGVAEAEANVFYVRISLGAKFLVAGDKPEKGIGVEATIIATTENDKPALAGGFTITGAAIYYAYWAEVGVKEDESRESLAPDVTTPTGRFIKQPTTKEHKVKKEKLEKWTEILKSRSWLSGVDDEKSEEQQSTNLSDLEN